MNPRTLFAFVFGGLLAAPLQAQPHTPAGQTPAVLDVASNADGHSFFDDMQMDHSQMDHAQMDRPQMDHSQMDHSQMDHPQMDHPQMDHPQMDHPQMDHPQMDHSQMDHSQMDHSQMDHSQMDHSQMDHPQMDHSQMDHAQMDHAQMDHAQMDHSQMDHSQMDHAQMDHSQMDHSQMDHAQMDHAQMDHAVHGETTRVLLPTPTPAALAAAFPPLRRRTTHASPLMYLVRIDRLEAWNADPERGHAWEAQAWIGGDIHRLWLRSDGERRGGRLQSAGVETLYGQAVSPWWDVLIGVRRDVQPDSRTWVALGVQGLAPYKFENAALLYLGGGAVRLMLEAKYELLFTQRLILQPRLQATAGLTQDHDLGPGFQTLQLGLRLRYEITRRVAPYVGWEREHRYGDHARRARGRGVPDDANRLVAGIRWWF
ncbi:copper resistance protein B [Xylella taiwanensis]|uniref:copper resistance protein B n=1 Tax=Xylella taiwanensis TaxID=1444770 RepID=UPI0022B4C55B|nr:copper resistance protein B [Xylella taiwanensis]